MSNRPTKALRRIVGVVLMLALASCTDQITYGATHDDEGARSTRQNPGGG